MSEDKKPAAPKKPGIVASRPLLKDSAATDDAPAPAQDEASDGKKLAHSTGPKLQPLEGSPQPQPAEPEKQKPPEPAPAPAPQPQSQPQPDDKQQPANKQPKPKPDAAAVAQAKHDAAIQKLVDSRKYELPINAEEQRQAKHFVTLGIVLAVLLALAWADIALDAGLVHIDGLHSVTHFF